MTDSSLSFMGLTLHFELRLPGSTSPATVAERLERLRQFALHTEVSQVSDLYTTDRLWEPAPGQAVQYEGFFRFSAQMVADSTPDEPGTTPDWNERSAVGFVVDPGRESELAPFGFIRAHGTREEWYWRTSCKTQYASSVSEEHFVTCHTALVAILDRAAEIGIQVDVSDEGEYWESRDTDVLLAALRKTNHITAAFAGYLSDTMPSMKLEATIFRHREFERIEMEE